MHGLGSSLDALKIQILRRFFSDAVKRLLWVIVPDCRLAIYHEYSKLLGQVEIGGTIICQRPILIAVVFVAVISAAHQTLVE